MPTADTCPVVDGISHPDLQSPCGTNSSHSALPLRSPAEAATSPSQAKHGTATVLNHRLNDFQDKSRRASASHSPELPSISQTSQIRHRRVDTEVHAVHAP